MNSYEARQEARKTRLEAAAEKARQEAESRFQRAHSAVEHIPFGQPILVGHHSEGRHRAAIKRMAQNMDAGCAASRKAEDLARAASQVGSAGISSDDPDAILKLQEKLAGMEEGQARMKAINTAHSRFLKDPASLDTADLSEGEKNAIRTYRPAYSWEPHPFPPYAMQNNNANIRRVRERLTQLKQEAAQRETVAEVKVSERQGFTVREDPEENRILITFDAIPPKEARELLRRGGWKWSPTRSAWVRMLNDAGRWSVQDLCPRLEALAL